MSIFHKYNSCQRKVRYGRRTTADEAVRKMSAKTGQKNLESYLCDYCGGYHIGHKMQPITITLSLGEGIKKMFKIPWGKAKTMKNIRRI